ncbi:hypothetical protein [Seonamhaeicola sp. ML3]|uniref:hypothetical protein n=1 Tax=Seonamhaeicola sp. ML3 TaxID=2937786 RepID=UPI0020109C92|nr:hypothetical protein [Seonamhaeicola sp. ML3]
MSLFESDLNDEQLLGKYLDKIYEEINIPIERTHDTELQFRGVDIIYKSSKGPVYIDEKSQLHYINKDLPTFTFELSFLKNGKEKRGWFLDKEKITDYYFLVTGIYVNKDKQLNSGLKSCKITSVNRLKLIELLKDKGLSPLKLNTYSETIRSDENAAFKTEIPELKPKTEGCLVYSNQLDEKPINLMLRLNFLIQKGVAKQIYPATL